MKFYAVIVFPGAYPIKSFYECRTAERAAEFVLHVVTDLAAEGIIVKGHVQKVRDSKRRI